MINKNVLVTGGNGMIGKRLVELLKHEGADVRVADLPEYNLTKFSRPAYTLV